jgi:hypothetical protein
MQSPFGQGCDVDHESLLDTLPEDEFPTARVKDVAQVPMAVNDHCAIS